MMFPETPKERATFAELMHALSIIDTRERVDDIERDIALIHLAMAMLLGLSAGAFVVSLVGVIA